MARLDVTSLIPDDPGARAREAAELLGPHSGGDSSDAQWQGLQIYWQLVKRRKLLIIACMLLGLIAGFAALLFTQPVYQATTTIELQGFNESFMGMSNVDPEAGTGKYAVTQPNINTQLRIIESASVRGPVMERLTRETTPVLPPANNFMSRLRSQIRRGPDDPLRQTRDALGMASMTLSARSIMGTRIIAIGCESTIPDVAANFANTLAAEYILQNAQQRSISTQRTSQWLETQLEETKIKLEQAETRLSDFEKQSGVTFVGDQETLANSKLRSLQGDLAAIQADRIAKQAKYDQLKAAPVDSIPEVVDDVNLRQMQLKLADLKGQYAELTATMTPAYPKAQRLQALITEATTELAKQKEAVLQKIRADYEAAQRREQLLQTAYQTQAGAVTSQTDKLAQYGLLKREVDIYRQSLNAMLQQVNQSALVAAVPTNSVRIIDQAVAPGYPSKPTMTSYGAYSLMGGFGMGVLAALLLEKRLAARRKATLATPGYTPTILNVPELGVIPSASVDLVLRNEKRLAWRHVPRLGIGSKNGNENGPVELVTSQAHGSFVAESFRLALTSILLMQRRGRRAKTIVITSPGPGEGKTTVVSNMAIACAESGRKVLLVDSDLRKPRLHGIFAQENGRGLSDVLASADLIEGELEGLATPTTIEGVSLLSSGAAEVPNMSQLFHSTRLPGVIQELTGKFDVILIDTPPMLQFSDARLIASFADGVILVIRSGITDREAALAARQQLLRDQIPVLGTILNDWDPKEGGGPNQYNSYYSAYMRYHKTVEGK